MQNQDRNFLNTNFKAGLKVLLDSLQLKIRLEIQMDRLEVNGANPNLSHILTVLDSITLKLLKITTVQKNQELITIIMQ